MNVKQRLEELQNFNTDRASLDEMLLVENDANVLRASYERHQIPVPEWLEDQNGAISSEVTRRTHDDLQRRLKEIDQTEAGLLSASEKRDRLAKEREKIQARLGIASAKTTDTEPAKQPV